MTMLDCGTYGVAYFSPSIENEICLIEKLEWLMLQEEQVEIPERHIFSNGIYCKEIFIPKGTLAIGHAHTEEFFEAITTGKMIMFGEENERIEKSAPYIGVGKPFKRKCGYALEDTIWATFHATSETDVRKIEEKLIIKSPTWLAMEKVLIARNDFRKLLKEIGVTAEIAREQSENPDDLISMPAGYCKVKVKKSEIEGFGLFSSQFLQSGDIICYARVLEKRTPAGRFTNHSPLPNARMKADDSGDIFLIANENIKKGMELTVDYRNALQVNLLTKESPCQQ